jgi:PBP1b-binding outer membrane lipoprotein LpoB
MKRICFAAGLVVLIAGCSSTSSTADNRTAARTPADTDTYLFNTPNGAMTQGSTSKPPRLSVGVSYSDTQLILPWLLRSLQ